jgi:hypothetical protein
MRNCLRKKDNDIQLWLTVLALNNSEICGIERYPIGFCRGQLLRPAGRHELMIRWKASAKQRLKDIASDRPGYDRRPDV